MTTSIAALRYALRQVCDDLRRHDPESRALAYAEGVMAASGPKAYDGPPRLRGRPCTDPATAAAVVAAYQAGATIEGAGCANGITTPTARRILTSAGVPRRAYTRKGNIGERNERIVARHQDGESLASLGRHFGISRERVRRIVKRASTVDK